MTTTTGTNAFPSRRAALAYYKTAAGDPTCTLKDIDRKIAEGAIRIHAPKLGDCVIVNGERRWLYIDKTERRVHYVVDEPTSRYDMAYSYKVVRFYSPGSKLRSRTLFTGPGRSVVPGLPDHR
jgi:hypothetical protein